MNTIFNEKLLLNQAVTHHKLGEYEKARQIYQLILNINERHFDALQLMGLLEFQTKNYKNSIRFYEKAVRINPNNASVLNVMGLAYEANEQKDNALKTYDHALQINSKEIDALNNKANLLTKMGRIEEANVIYDKAYQAEPNSALINYNYGNFLLDLKKFEEAIKHYQTALSNEMNAPGLYNNLCIAYTALQQKSLALEYGAIAIQLDSDNIEFKENFKTAMGMRSQITRPLPEIVRKVIQDVVSHLTVRPETIVDLLVNMVQIQFNGIHLQAKHDNPLHHERIIDEIKLLSKNKIFLKLLTLCPVSNEKIESVITILRNYITLNHEKLTLDNDFLELLLSMAIQSHITEYIFSESDAESAQIKVIKDKIKSSSSRNDDETTALILILSIYREIDQDVFPNDFSKNQYLLPIYDLHVKNKQIEIAFKNQIETIGIIENEISIAAKSQYEESPYPRWFYINILPYKLSFRNYLNELELKFNKTEIFSKNELDILIAGCGTGRSTIELAQNFANMNITAIDLSSSSLAYAKRMAERFNISNIDFKQCDILDASVLDKHFDVINADGVLHHLENPIEGLNSLIRLLNPGGFIKISVYSEIARQDISTCRDEIARLGYTDSLRDIKKYRNICASSDFPHHRGLRSFSDFYSLSEFRDLVFHVKEHQFTWGKIADLLNQSNLSFCGFSSIDITNKIYQDNSSRRFDLTYLGEYEEKNRNTFKEMYQFWCQKI